MGNKIRDFLEILFCVYGIIKHTFRKNLSICNNKNLDTPLQIFYITITLLTYAIIIIILTPFIIIRQILDVYLRKRYGTKYGGMLKGMDVIWLAESRQSRHICNGLFILQLNYSPEEFLNHFRRTLRESQRIQFNSTVHNFLSYWYRLKSGNILERVVKVIDLSEDERRNRDKFEAKFSRVHNSPLPKHSYFEFLLSSEPISFQDTKNSHKSNYVMILRAHHSVGDGLNFVRFLLEHLIDRESIPKEIKTGNDSNLKKSLEDLQKKYREIVKRASIYHYSLTASCDENILRGPKLSGEALLTFYVEDEPKYVSKIKAIKRRFDGCRFSDVVYAALSASLCKFFQEHNKENIPDNIFVDFTTMAPKIPNDNEHLESMNSTFCAVSINLPIKIDEAKGQGDTLITRLNIILAREKLLQQSIDALLFYWTYKHCYFLPAWLLRYIGQEHTKSTILISNLPGINAVTMDGQCIKDVLFLIPTVYGVGVGITFLSYDGRLQLGLTVDKALIPSREKASTILENFCKYIDVLSDEVNAM